MKMALSAIDASFWHIHTETTSQVITWLAFFETTPNTDDLLASLEILAQTIPKLRCKLEGSGKLFWVENENFAVKNHFEVLCDPSIKTRMDLLNVASARYTAGLRRDEPLWKYVLISNAIGHKPEQEFSALLLLVHHALSDGFGMRSIINVMTGENLKVKTKADRSLKVPKIKLWPSVMRLFHEVRRPMSAPHIKGTNSSQRLLRTFDFSLTKVRELKDDLGVSINDVCLAVISQSFSDYCRENTAVHPDIFAIVPVNTRAIKTDTALGNKLTGISIQLNLQPKGFLESIREINAQTSSLRQSGGFGAYALMAECARHLPPLWQKRIYEKQAKRANLICSTMIPTFDDPLSHVSPITQHYGIPALMKSHGISFLFGSYMSNIQVGVISDPAIIPDIDSLIDKINELLQLHNLI